MPAQAQLRKSKPDRGPRAIAVVRWQTDAKGKSVPRLLPVVVLEDGKFYDGGLYRATPRPMALEPGVVYEAQDKGDLLGYFTLQGALRNNASKKWYGVGKWEGSSSLGDPELRKRPQSAEVVRPGAKAATSPTESVDDRDIKKTTVIFDEEGKPEQPGAADDDGPPTLRRPQEGEIERRPQVGPSKPSAPPASTSPSSNDSNPSSAADDDPERPRLKRGAPASTSPATTSAQGASSTAAPGTSPSSATSKNSASEVDPDRPVLRRGGQPQRSAAETAASQGTTVPIRIQARGDVIPNSPKTTDGFSHRVFEAVAVSDANDKELRQDFRYRWRDTERDELTAKMRALAAQEVSAFLKRTGQQSAALARSATTASTRTKARKKPLQVTASPALIDLQVAGLDLDFNNAAELVYSGRTVTESDAGGPAKKTVHVTIVARVDIDGNPRRLFSSVTTDDRLDVSPRLWFVDAVDSEGDGRAELLFRRVRDTGAEFAIYRVGVDGLTEIFHGGNAE